MSEALALLTAEDSPGGIIARKWNTKGNKWVNRSGFWWSCSNFKENSNFE